MSRAINDLENLRKWRAKPAADLSISALVQSVASEASRTQKKLGELVELWEQLVPQEVAAHTSLSSLRGGVLHVIVESSAVSFELDRLLRAGLTNDLRKAYRGTLVRVKTRVGKLTT